MKRALLLATLLGPLAACGRGAAPDAARAVGGWSHARVPGVAKASGIAVAGDWLVVSESGPDRRLLAVRRADLVDGKEASAHPVEVTFDPEAHLTGGDAFALRGYRLGDVWGLDGSVEGVAVQSPARVFLADRAWRVVFAGELRTGDDGAPKQIVIDRGFTVSGGNRSGSDASDWRDRGPGLAGLAAGASGRRVEDVYAVTRGAEGPGTFELHALDRYGIELSTFTVDLGTKDDAAVGGLALDEDRFLVVRGAGRGELVAFRRGRPRELVKSAPGIPAAEVEGAGAWSGVARSDDQVLYLVSQGAPAVVAWRAIRPR